MAFYGLPAAGIISLALLNTSASSTLGQNVWAEIVQKLCVLVTEIRLGAVVRPGEPNYELFTQAMRTMQNLLDITMTGQRFPNLVESGPDHVQQSAVNTQDDGWIQWLNAEPWEFELDFWTNLAEHPSLSGVDPAL